MGATRTDLYTDEQNALADLARVLSHPARISILQYLAAQQVCITNDLVDEIGLAQPTMTQHLKALQSVGLIKGEVEGVRKNYCLVTSRCRQISGLISGLFDGLCCEDDRC